MLIENYSIYVNNFLKKSLYFDTSALLKEFVNEIGSDLISKITSPNTNDIQIISSVWSIKKPKNVILEPPYLAISTVQLIILHLYEGSEPNENSFFRFVYLNHAIITDSRVLIKDFHLSPKMQFMYLQDMYMIVITS
jgi:hypothetical protein